MVSYVNVKALVGAFNQEKAPVGTFLVIVKTDGSFAALTWRRDGWLFSANQDCSFGISCSGSKHILILGLFS